MRFHIGPFIYDAYLVRGYVLHEGRQCLGLCQHEERRVLISDRLDPVEQFQVLCHELWHAWKQRFAPEQVSEEVTADLVGIAMTQLAVDLYGSVPKLMQGGLEYLDAPPLAPAATYVTQGSEARNGGPARPTYRVQIFEPPAELPPPSPRG